MTTKLSRSARNIIARIGEDECKAALRSWRSWLGTSDPIRYVTGRYNLTRGQARAAVHAAIEMEELAKAQP